jgi:MEDS: MEthanogen/methylotroph, DcmR Sensory domain
VLVLATPEEDAAAVRRALRSQAIDIAEKSRRGALTIVSSDTAYGVHGDFVPEHTMRMFSDAIEQALADGFTGFGAAEEMSWILSCNDGGETLITYKALLRSLFQTSRLIGLCLS